MLPQVAAPVSLIRTAWLKLGAIRDGILLLFDRAFARPPARASSASVAQGLRDRRCGRVRKATVPQRMLSIR